MRVICFAIRERKRGNENIAGYFAVKFRSACISLCREISIWLGSSPDLFLFSISISNIPSFTACGKGIHGSLRKRTFLVFCSKGLVQPGEVQAR
ncbi:hypothetical protein L1987_54386 [Smallanthus sonchifolius]|uniref:Uncharacterized protein n=1 Tax=Smallanthus sonchifolius TaxID=185202 RepID=A0ACB9E6J7_9ASTR|nr:hypothetical protein L1987_54386 [Smallanthus sonchifolius]